MGYYLAEACQNTFIIFNQLHKKIADERFLLKAHEALLIENADDALILIDSSFKKESMFLQMLVLGHDKTLGEFCGNGARACASLLFETYPRVKKFFLKTAFGSHELKNHQAGIYSINMPLPRFEANPKFVSQTIPDDFRYVEIIEPHLVCQKMMSDEQLISIGKSLNQQRNLFPRGINVNAYQIQDDQTLFVKTYERGVQRLTKSCGTGSLSCSFVFNPQGQTEVITPGGVLEITFNNHSSLLKGQAAYIKAESMMEV